MVGVRVGVVGGGSHLIEAAARVGRRGHLPRWNTRRNVVWNDGMLVVLGRLVLQQRLVEVLELPPVGSLMVVARVGILQVRRSLDET